ncbi:MAG: pyridoxamine 5'-phosphate oxidase family protein [Vicinamibacteria bacterium]
MSFLSTAVQAVLEEGPFCAVATMTPRGPHCTPLVFAYSSGRLWLTTSRGSVKARA